ncbi:hypothetical protein [Nonomuraea sp. SYSU D8015]|uniref:hypothetical protein n=1 Tax=Nonomuraea sp. SYSU D8015 TaxID=2593644 RepID=UPI001660FAE5|nr:hypothetical protein [Nonomuraea sp. SYSU D8015]
MGRRRHPGDRPARRSQTPGLGAALGLLHDALPTGRCPFDWSIQRRLERADERIADGEEPADWFPSTGISTSPRPGRCSAHRPRYDAAYYRLLYDLA